MGKENQGGVDGVTGKPVLPEQDLKELEEAAAPVEEGLEEGSVHDEPDRIKPIFGATAFASKLERKPPKFNIVRSTSFYDVDMGLLRLRITTYSKREVVEIEMFKAGISTARFEILWAEAYSITSALFL